MGGITITGVFIVAVLAIFFVFGYKAGLLKSLFGLFSFFISAMLTWILYPIVSSALVKTPLYDKLLKLITTTLKGDPALEQSLPEFLMGLPGFMKDSVIVSSKKAFSALIESTGEAMTLLAINLITVIGLFLIFKLLSVIIRKYSQKINKIFMIGKINAFFGGLFGLLQGIFTVYIIIFIISLFPTMKLYNIVADDLEVSYIGRAVFTENKIVSGLNLRYPKKLNPEKDNDLKGTENRDD